MRNSQQFDVEDVKRFTENAATKVLRHTVNDNGDNVSSPAIDTESGVLPHVFGYDVMGELGRGSMGVVYKAKQKGLDRIVALKMIRTGTHAGAEELQRFLNEARVVASLQHPNIVHLYEVNLRGDTPYYSMEMVEGGSLADHLQGRPQAPRQSAQLILTVARAMQVCHENGIIHRDLKPGNILLAAPKTPSSVPAIALEMMEWNPNELATRTPKITDFGLAKQLHGEAGQTESGMIMGTPSYMAPEQAEGKSRDVGPAADIYALGAILYEMLTGRPPFLAESSMETVLLLFQTEPVPPSRLQPKIPRDLETICLKCLHKDSKRRYANAEALAEDVQRFLAGELIHARRASLWERGWKWCRKHPTLGTFAACMALSIVGAVALVLSHQVSLHAQLEQAIHDERATRATEQATSEREQLAQVRVKVNELVHRGETALSAHDWHNADLHLNRARDTAAERPELSELQHQIDGLLTQTRCQKFDRERLQRFKASANHAIFSATLFTGSDLPTARAEARQSALAALSLFRIAIDSDTPPDTDSKYYSESERREIRESCLELLVVLAEVMPQAEVDQSVEDRAKEALRVLDRAASLQIATRALYQRRAHFLEQNGFTDAAQEDRRRADALVPKTALDHFLMGQDQYRQGMLKDAAASFDNALQVQPDHFWAAYYSALCSLKSQRPDRAAALLTTCLSQRREFPWPYLLRASAWSELGQFERSEADFEMALKSALPESARYSLLVNRGVMRLRGGQSDAAIADLHAAITLRPKQYQAYVNLAQALVKAQPAEALRQLDTAIALQPELASLYRSRARLHASAEHWSEAAADWDHTLARDPEAPALVRVGDCVERGRALQKCARHVDALASCDEALRLLPGDVRAQRLRAEILLALHRPGEALAALDVCLQQGETDAAAFRARAALRMRLGRYAGALTDYTRALELEPNAATYAARGWCHLVASAPKFALPDFEEALRLDPDLGDAYLGRGSARVVIGDPRLARADVEEAVRRGPESVRLYYNAARVHAQALVRSESDPQRSRAQASACQERALVMLSKSLQAQPSAEAARFWHEVVQLDKTLQSLRNTPEFKQLFERYAVSRPTAAVAIPSLR